MIIVEDPGYQGDKYEDVKGWFDFLKDLKKDEPIILVTEI